MKNYYKIFVLTGLFMYLSSCQEELPRMGKFLDYAFTDTDINAGTWTTVLVGTPGDIIIDVPADISSPSYQAELTDLKQEQASIGQTERDAIKYWTNNPVLRWNEIALDLVAKYNLIPGPNESGGYTLPNPSNPEGPPAFPFAHPPYAVRVYAYLGVAQYDGLVTAWHYKKEFDRASPYINDSEIISYYVQNGLPSYPSDGAVVATVSRRVLTAMFPLEAEYLMKKAEEHLNSLRWSGENVQSDIDAGISIGDQVADLALSRAASDGMAQAQCDKATADQIREEAFQRFGWEWINQEIPERGVGLTPLYSQVQTWKLTDLLAVRPPIPPAPGSPEYEADVKKLKDIAANVTEEQRRIANYWQHGLGTYTPPGHWNKVGKELAVAYKLSPVRTARMFAYLNMAMMDAGISCWDAKYYYHYPRPIQQIEGFKTIAGTPNFPSYTSGHSVFSAAGAEILAYVFPDEADWLRKDALEAAISRVYGGIHWTFDAEAGTQQGIDVAAYTIDAAKADGADN